MAGHRIPRTGHSPRPLARGSARPRRNPRPRAPAAVHVRHGARAGNCAAARDVHGDLDGRHDFVCSPRRAGNRRVAGDHPGWIPAGQARARCPGPWRGIHGLRFRRCLRSSNPVAFTAPRAADDSRVLESRVVHAGGSGTDDGRVADRHFGRQGALRCALRSDRHDGRLRRYFTHTPLSLRRDLSPERVCPDPGNSRSLCDPRIDRTRRQQRLDFPRPAGAGRGRPACWTASATRCVTGGSPSAAA